MDDAEAALVRSAQEGSRLAFEHLVRRTSGLVFARLYLETGDAHLAEDLSQETFLIAYRSLGQLANSKGFRSWLLTIAQNTAIDSARRSHRLKRSAPHEPPESLNGVSCGTPAPDEVLERDELRQRVLGILRSLPEDYRLPITMRYISGADYETIRTQLGLTNGSLRGLLHRGLKLLRDKLEQQGAQAVLVP